ncbi:MAG: hypothetical protein IKW83_07670 [Muribaculaceae bacterium]|nr:hypothetical protein [Muribaculaceae bacterium]
MNDKTKQLIGNILLCISMTALMAAAAIPLFITPMPSWQRYMLAAGAAGTLVAQFFIPSPSDDFRIRRLSRMNVWAGIVYCVGAYCLFSSNPDMHRSWIAFLLAGAVLQIYATFMLSRLTNSKKREKQIKEVKDKE